MNKKAVITLLVLVVALTALPLFAQDGGAAASNEHDVKIWTYIAAGFAMAIGSAMGGFSQSRAVVAACEGAARNPGAAAKIQLMMILGLAFIESLVLFLLVVIFAKVGG